MAFTNKSCTRYYFFLITFFSISGFFSQNSTSKIGTWTDHLNYSSIKLVECIDNTIYYSNGLNLVKYNTDDNSIEKLNKFNPLNDFEIQLIKKINNNALLVIYKNSNIDIVYPNGSVTNYSDIKRKLITGNKTIYNVLVNDQYAYLSTGYGIVVFDLNKLEIKETYNLDKNTIVYQLAINDTALIAATNNGLLYGLKLKNLIDNTNWKELKIRELAGKPFNGVVVHNTKILANYARSIDKNDAAPIKLDTLFEFNPQTKTWSVFESLKNTINLKLLSNEQYNLLTVITPTSLVDFNINGVVNNSITTYAPKIPQVAAINNVVYTNSKSLWIADNNLGLINYTNNTLVKYLLLNGPNSNFANRIVSKSGILLTAPVSLGRPPKNKWDNTFPSAYIDEQWVTVNTWGLATDINALDIDKDNNRLMFACMGAGLVDMARFNTNFNITNIFNNQNSPMIGLTANDIRVTGVGIDSKSNTWALVTLSDRAIQIYNKNKTWTLLDFTNFFPSQPAPEKIIFTENNHAWITLGQGGGMLVYKDVLTQQQPNSSNTKRLTTKPKEGGLPSTDVYAICEDLNGAIWIGTQQGIAVFNNPANVFTNNNFDCAPILIEQDGNIQKLLFTEAISSIVVDGANQKWIGTESSGVYCVSADGQKEIYHFTKENSPLISNSINDITINQLTGDVFFATNLGIQSFKGVETKAETTYTSLHVFPNPVKPNYQGSVYINGLVNESIVKITDITGNLVWENKAQSGRLEWDLKTLSGNRVESGIYLIHCATANGEYAETVKLLVLN